MSIRDSLLPSAHRSPNYSGLLFLLIVLIVVAPSATGPGAIFIVEALLDLVLVAGAYSAAARAGHSWPFLALTALTLLVRWSAVFARGTEFELVSSVITVIWIVYAIVIIGKQLFVERKVTTNMIFGAVIAYLLAAIAFSFVYEAIELQQPGSFSGLPDGAGPLALGDALLYFSLVSLTTVGYGDILPVSALARPLAVLEGAFGTLYLAVVIARLVGLHIAAAISGQGDGS
ncbi:MAG: two pore domain potassium channel family protein [Myxococcales bacterium]|nr:two pore domain potassium channel family protein [Myxococcales bacterium]